MITSKAPDEALPAIYHVKFNALQTHANVKPRDAATMILIDRTSDPARVLLGRRHAAHVFMPGKLVFPGGRVDADDCRITVANQLDPAIEARLMAQGRVSKARARALAVAAIRELYEETGLCIGAFDGAVPDHNLKRPFAQSGLRPDLSCLHFVARAITPPRLVRRFDARFFAADAAAVTHRIDGVVTTETELVELVWLPIADALQEELPPIVRQVLTDLATQIAAGLSHQAPVPSYAFSAGHMRRHWIQPEKC